MNKNPTYKDVATYMKKQLIENSILYQDLIALDIKAKFGSDFVYTNPMEIQQ